MHWLTIAVFNRSYAVVSMTESLKEIIRVLQLTSPMEEGALACSTTQTQQAGRSGNILPGTQAAMVLDVKNLLEKTSTYS